MNDINKTSFGLDQISSLTPVWATWLFRGWLILSNALTGFITSLVAINGIHLTPVTVGIIMASINFLNLIVYGFSKLFGVVTEPADPGKPLIADKQVVDGGTKAVDPVIVDAPEK